MEHGASGGHDTHDRGRSPASDRGADNNRQTAACLLLLLFILLHYTINHNNIIVSIHRQQRRRADGGWLLFITRKAACRGGGKRSKRPGASKIIWQTRQKLGERRKIHRMTEAATPQNHIHINWISEHEACVGGYSIQIIWTCGEEWWKKPQKWMYLIFGSGQTVIPMIDMEEKRCFVAWLIAVSRSRQAKDDDRSWVLHSKEGEKESSINYLEWFAEK